MSFLNPTYLWALLGLAVPLAIHLWSKKEGKTIKIGSIRLLKESDPKQTSNLKLNELLLLLLRLLIITVLTLILAEPHITEEKENTPLLYLIEPSLLEDNEIRKLADSLDENSSVKMFSEGLPDYVKDEQDHKNFKVPDYWQLTREIDNLAADSIVVFTNAFQKGFKGKIPEIGKNINWIILDPGMPETFYVEAILKGDNVELISVAGTGQNLEISKENLPLNSDKFSLNDPRDSIFISSEGKREQLLLRTTDSLRVAIFYAEDFSDEMKFIRSSYSAIGKYIDQHIQVQIFQKEDSLNNFRPSAIVWLSVKSPLQTETPILVYREDSLSEELVVQNSAENRYQLTGRLNSENIISGNLAEKLLSMLNLHPELVENIQKVDQRVMDREDILPLNASFISEENNVETTALAKYLWILLLLLLLAERGFARYRKQ